MGNLKELCEATKKVCNDYHEIVDILDENIHYNLKKEAEDQKAFDAEFDELFSQIKK